MSSTAAATRKRARDADEQDDNIECGQNLHPLAVDRMNNRENKRPRLAVPGLVSPPSEDVDMSSMPIDSDWSEGHSQVAAAKPAPSGLTSPPLSPGPISLNNHPSSMNGSSSSSSTPLSSSLLPPASGPRITIRKPLALHATSNPGATMDSEDDDNEDVEDYDPDEVQLDIGSDSDDDPNEADADAEEDDGDEANESRLRDPSSSSTSSSIPLSQMNALLHELHFSHRRLRHAPPQLPPTIPILTSSTGIVSSSKAPSTPPMRVAPSAKGSAVSDVTAIVPTMDRSAVEAAKAAAVRRERMQKEKGLTSSPAATEQSVKELLPTIPSLTVEQSNVGAQYEETNRLLGALFLSRRRHMNVADEDRDDL